MGKIIVPENEICLDNYSYMNDKIYSLQTITKQELDNSNKSEIILSHNLELEFLPHLYSKIYYKEIKYQNVYFSEIIYH